MLVKNAIELVGNTPLVELTRIEKQLGLKARLFAKVEYFNPTGSVKDRAALFMVLDAEEKGLLKEGFTIIEPTSGNTGIGLAFLGAIKGYRVILTMPESMSIERRKLLKAYGAEIVLTEASKGMKGAIAKANELKEQIPNSIILGQFDNPANVKAHYEGTGPEIYRDLDGKVDIFVAGVGTGGTLTGVGKFLKEQNPNIKVVAVEPVKSSVLSGNPSGPHGIQGIGAGFIPSILDTNIYDAIMPRLEEQSYEASHLLGSLEGMLVGISSGAALSAGIELAQLEENAGKNIVVLLPDSGDRYLSTPLFKE